MLYPTRIMIENEISKAKDSGESMTDSAVVLLSGGIDSATCLGIACRDHDHVLPVHVQYGQQTDAVEREMAAAQRDHFADTTNADVAPATVVDYESVFAHFAGGVAAPDKEFGHQNEADGRSSGYVPMRNLHLIATAAAFADVHDATAVYHGAQAGDEADYPDCRGEFMAAAGAAIARSVPETQPLHLKTPLLHTEKADVLRLADDLGVAFQYTYSCYRRTPVESPTPCGDCPACLERAEAFSAADIADPYNTGVAVNE